MAGAWDAIASVETGREAKTGIKYWIATTTPIDPTRSLAAGRRRGLCYAGK